jgi:dihydrofolate synthase/folylpolyglutamate synthase
MLEHVQQLGPTLERIAWHKAGIIKPHSYAYSVPQAAEVLAVLEREAETEQAEFFWIASMDMGSLVAPTPTGIQMTLGRYGLLDVSLMGYYQVENVTLAVQGVGNMHGRLGGISHGAPEYVERIRAGLADVRWPGRLHQLQSHPAVYVDGAINGASARALAESLESRLSEPVIAVIGVPDDKDYAGVYTEIGLIADRVILTETTRNPSLNFLEPSVALAVASRFNPDTEYAPDVQAAVARALSLAGSDGTVLVVGTLSVVADTILLWGESYEQI